MDKLPTLSVDLIRALDDEFKFKPISPTDSIADIMYDAGRRKIIDYLKIKLIEPETMTAEELDDDDDINLIDVETKVV